VNTPRASDPVPAPLGPRPARPHPVELSRAQSRVLADLTAAERPLTLADLSRSTGLHANTLREHLDALVRTGRVRREQGPPAGPGRPRTLYESAGDDGAQRRSEYAGLASALASAIHRTSDHPREDATVAGEQWGHELAADRGRSPGRATRRPTGARREVVAMLEEIGFAPEPDADAAVVRLTRCPLLEAARRHPDVVCAVHLGIVRGALEEYDADPEPAQLFPFSEPGACRLHLSAVR